MPVTRETAAIMVCSQLSAGFRCSNLAIGVQPAKPRIAASPYTDPEVRLKIREARWEGKPHANATSPYARSTRLCVVLTWKMST